MDPLTALTVPSETDILNEIEKFQTDNNNNNTLTNASKKRTATSNSASSSGDASDTKQQQQPIVDQKSNKKLQNPQDTVLTRETIKIFSSMHFDKFKNLPFSQQFDLLFSDIQFFKTASVQGALANTNLRCISWMISLDCIPFDKSQWAQFLAKNRDDYNRIKHEMTINPRDESNLNVDHPLAQDTESDWNRYFANNSLKSVILQDVLRIHKPSQFFHEASTHELIIELLFIYVKYTNSEYRQGMHEILVCLMYVLHDEYVKLYEHHSNEHIKSVANLEFLEHDTFTLFVSVMSTIYEWFNSTTKQKRPTSTLENPKIFQPEEDVENVITSKINHITNVLLRNNDTELYFYFINNDISLAPFGIRWLRLLFLRELEFPPCLILWDAIFAIDNTNFSLADYIFLSLLTSLRDRIIFTDHSNCMRLLMQQDLRIDCLNILKRALYLQNPETFSMPDSMMEDSFEYIQSNNTNNDQYFFNNNNSNYNNINNTLTKNSSAIFSKPNMIRKQQQQDEIQRMHKSSSLFVMNPPDQNNISTTPVTPNNNAFSNSKLQQSNTSSNKLWQREMKLMAFENLSHNKDLVTYQYINKISELQNENELLKIKLSDLEDLCQMCSTKMNASIGLLQEEILRLGISNSVNTESGVNKGQEDSTNTSISSEDAMFLALAGLKQVRDQLSFSFIDDEKILAIDELNKKLKAQNNISPSKLKLSFLKHFKFHNTPVNETKLSQDGDEQMVVVQGEQSIDSEDNGIKMNKIQLVMNPESSSNSNESNNNNTSSNEC